MGESTQTTQSQNSTTPWAAAMPTVNNLFGAVNSLIPNSGVNSTEQGAINQLTANGEAGNPYAGAVGGVATNLLNGGGATSENPALTTNLSNFENGMATYTDPNYSTLNNPTVRNALNQIGTDTTDQINSQFAAAGRSGSGENQQAVARGVAQAEAPLLLNQANTDTATREAALSGVYGAGNTTANAITNNDQTGVKNSVAGIPAANAAVSANNWGPEQVLQAQELGQKLPAQNLGLLANIGIPLAQLGTNSSGTSTTQSDPSMLSELTSLGGLFAGGANSPISGMANAAGGVMNGIGSLLPFLAL